MKTFPGLSATLMTEFFSCIGEYPVGSIVSLRSRRLAIVTKNHASAPMQPTVMTFYSLTGKHFVEVKHIDLRHIEDDIEATVSQSDLDNRFFAFFREWLGTR